MGHTTTNKITILVWRIYWNFISIMVNLCCKRVANNTMCPRCGVGEEHSYHVFRQCPRNSAGCFAVHCSSYEAQGIYNSENTHSQTEETLRTMVLFDAAFDGRNLRSASGVVVRDQRGC